MSSEPLPTPNYIIKTVNRKHCIIVYPFVNIPRLASTLIQWSIQRLSENNHIMQYYTMENNLVKDMDSKKNGFNVI